MLDEDEITSEEAGGHSVFGASKAHRYLVCAGSITAEAGKPDNAGFEAAEGTVAHEIAAEMLYWGFDAEDLSGHIGETHKKRLATGTYDIVVDGAMLSYVGQYVEWCRAIPAREALIETRTDFSRLTPIPKQGGTADFVAMAPGKLVIVDLKYGTGVQVFAEKNPQLMLYALGVIYEWDFIYDFQEIELRIGQPRLEHWDIWTTSKAELLEWAEWAKDQMAVTWDRNAPRTPDEKACKWCKARGSCGAAMTLRDRLIDGTFEDLTVSPQEVTSAVARLESARPDMPLPAIPDMTTAQIAKMLSYRKTIEHHLEAAYVELVRRVVTNGEPVPDGWLIAKGRSARAIVPAERVPISRKLAELGFDYYDLLDVKFMSPAQLEDLLVKAGLKKAQAARLIAPYVRTEPGRPTLALAERGKTKAADLTDSFVDETL